MIDYISQPDFFLKKVERHQRFDDDWDEFNSCFKIDTYIRQYPEYAIPFKRNLKDLKEEIQSLRKELERVKIQRYV